ASLWQAYRGLRLIRSFPTRRSSDLGQAKEGISSEGRSEDRGHNQNRETAREKCGQKRADYQAKDDHPLPVNFGLDLPVVGHLSSILPICCQFYHPGRLGKRGRGTQGTIGEEEGDPGEDP